MKKFFISPLVILISLGLFSAVQAQSIYQLQPLSGFGGHGDGSLRPNDSRALNLGNSPLFDAASNERGMSYDPAQTNLVVVDTHTGPGASDHGVGEIYVLEALTGANRDDGFGGSLVFNTNGMPQLPSQTYPYAATAVADDGAVYVCNQVAAGSLNPFIIYRWASTVDPNPPFIAYSNSLAPALRWGTAMTIRGGGTNTQILIGSFAGTNVAIFTTADGSNFTSTVLTANLQVSSFDDGLAFGAGNTFWGKQASQFSYSVLACFAFDITAKTATPIASFPSSIFPDNDNLGPIAVNTNLNLLVALELTGGVVSGGPDHLRLYDISNFSNQPPALLDVETFPVDFANMTAPMGYINFKGTNVYVLNGNNGVMAFGVGQGAPPPPTLTSVPPATNYTVVGRTVTLTVAGFPAVSYQWRSNNVDIPSATNGTYTITSIQNTYNQALYTCVVTNVSGSTNASSRIVVVNPASFYHLNLQWAAYPLASGDADSPDHPYIFNGNGAVPGTPNLRSLAYYAPSNHLYCMTRAGNALSNYVFYVVDGSTGKALYKMNTNGITSAVGNGGIGLTSIAVSDDGAIYACNTAPQAGGGNPFDATKQFRLYRWANDNSNTQPVQIYVGDPAIMAGRAGATAINRWGDSLAVHGAGTSTVLMLDNNNVVGGTTRYLAFLTPTDGTLNTWNTMCELQIATGTTIGRSLEFDAASAARSGTLWQKRNATAVIQTGWDIDNPVDNPQPTKSSSAFPAALSGVHMDNSRTIALGVSCYSAPGPDTLDMYQISDLSNPLLLAQYRFPVNSATNHNANNANCINQTIQSGSSIFTLDTGNGLMAFTIAPGAPNGPQFFTQPVSARVVPGATVAFGCSTVQPATFQWQLYGTNVPGATSQNYSIATVAASQAGPYTVIASDAFGSVTSVIANLTVVLPHDEYSLSPIWNILPTNANGSIIIPTGGSSPNTRTLAYNALSNHLYLVSRAGNNTSNYIVYILDATSGSVIGALNTNGLYNAGAVGEAGIGLGGIGVADDGAIYACNIASDACGCGPNAGATPADSLFRVYRWASEDTNSGPTQIFSGDPMGAGAAVRWGDALTVRGSGTNTEIILDSVIGPLAVLRPTDQTMTAFTATPIASYPQSAGLGRSLQFGATNTVWQTRLGTGLRLSSYDTNSQLSSVLASYPNFASTIGPVAQDFSRKLLAAVDFRGTANTTPDTADLYDVADPITPLQIARYNFPTNQQANGNNIGQVVFAGTRVWALDANNGLMAFVINGPKLNIDKSGNSVVVSWSTNNAGFVLQSTASLSPPVTWSNVAATPTIIGERYYVTNANAGKLNYRLIK